MAWTTVPAPAPIGELTVGVTPAGVAFVSFGDGRLRLTAAAERVGAELVEDPGRTAELSEQLGEYLAGRRREFAVPIDWSLVAGKGRAVLQALHEKVGYGSTVTYGELAARSGAFGDETDWAAARGVGSMMGANPVPVIVPCHRVLAASGLGGFGGGPEIKRWLLTLEGVLSPTLDFESA